MKTLVLNSDYRPLRTWPLSLVDATEAISAIVRGRVDVVEEWPDQFFHSPSTKIAVPKTIALREYANLRGAPKFCRRSILLRDGYRCQYCGVEYPSDELTYDHVHPRSKGGQTNWLNIVMACIRCNALKRDKTCAQANLWPRQKPKQPTRYELLEAGLRLIPNDVREAWGDFLYWNAELISS